MLCVWLVTLLDQFPDKRRPRSDLKAGQMKNLFLLERRWRTFTNILMEFSQLLFDFLENFLESPPRL